MASVTVSQSIDAPIEVVFNTIADINQFSQAVPRIVKVKIVSDVKSGVGTRFRETRVMKGREATTELEVTEYVENDRIRIVAESHGTVWDSLFTVERKGERTELTMIMEAKARSLMARMMTRLICGMIAKTVKEDMEAVKAFCEKKV